MAPKRFSRMTLLLSIAAAIYLVLLLLPEFRSGGQGLVGKAAPPLHFVLSGLGPSTLDEFKGQAVLVNFWAEWCLPCLEEMPSLKVLEQKLDPKKFLLLAVNVEGKKSQATVDALAGQLPQHTVVAAQEPELDVYGVQALPYSVLIDAQGIVRKVYIGSRDWAKPSIIEQIQAFLP